MIYKNYEIPEQFCQTVQRLALKNVGNYDGANKKFMAPTLDPSENAVRQMRSEFGNYPMLEKVNFNDLIEKIMSSTSVDPIKQSVPSIHVGIGDDTALKQLQHIELLESSGAKTELIYLESNRFLVLRTTRGCLLPGDILQANILPIRIDARAEFTIYRNGQEIIPEMYVGDIVSFLMPEIKQILLYNSPDIYNVIDEDTRFGKVNVSENKLNQTEQSFLELALMLEMVVADEGKDALSSCSTFPNYDKLLTEAKHCGVGCYTLNLLLESYICASPTTAYNFVPEDWSVVEDEGKKKERMLKEHKKRAADYKAKKLELEDCLSKIRTRRVMIIFKAAGRIGDMSYVNQLEKDLDKLAELKSECGTYGPYGTKGWAKQMRLDAIANSKPKPGENAIIGAKLAGFIVLIITIGWIWFTSNQSMEVFDRKLEQADQILASGKYVEARDAYFAAYDEYTPRVTAMFVQGKMKKRVTALEEALENEIKEGIDQIKAMRLADMGKFTKVTEDLLFKLLELKPDDNRLKELHQQWLNN